jgi:2'-hydroxyisoflavone reductase
MSVTRRSFVSTLGAAPLLPAAPARKRILILGGTGFLGPATVQAALARGHDLTLFNRGRTRPGLFPKVEALLGDRDPKKGEGLNALRNRKWDAVIDNSGYFPRHVAASAQLLAPNAGQYIFISSISAYADNSLEDQDEEAKLATIPDPTVETITEQTYGALKVLCEKAAAAAFPGRAAIVRPGYIVGPDDPSGRFTYWPVRIDRGGEVLAPGAPSDPVQFIDVRDLGAWLITLVERGTTGTFNAAGPRNRLAWGDQFQACRKASNSTHTLTLDSGGLDPARGQRGLPHLGAVFGRHPRVPLMEEHPRGQGRFEVPPLRGHGGRHPALVQDPGRRRTNQAGRAHAGEGSAVAGQVEGGRALSPRTRATCPVSHIAGPRSGHSDCSVHAFSMAYDGMRPAASLAGDPWVRSARTCATLCAFFSRAADLRRWRFSPSASASAPIRPSLAGCTPCC